MSKRIKAVYELFDRTKAYSLKDAIAILKKTPKVKFDETIEVSAKINLDSKQAQAGYTIRDSGAS